MSLNAFCHWLVWAWGWLFPFSAWLLALGWVWHAGHWIKNLPQIADLKRIVLPRLEDLPGGIPHLTVIVPACNEATSIEATLDSLLASEGIHLQLIAVNDRSTDQTGAIMDQITARNLNRNLKNTLQVIHIESLRDGWLGKPHALATGAALAQAEWLLFTDGDVLFAPEALNLALRYANAERADHLVVMPDWVTQSQGEAAMHGAMHALSTWTMRLWRVADPHARDFLGVGAFNLIRRNTYEALGGFASLRMEVLEDLRLGWLVKRAGYRQRVALGLGDKRKHDLRHSTGLISVRWAKGAWGVVQNLEKNLFALYRYRTAIALFACFGLVAQMIWPLLAIAAGGWARSAGILTYVAIIALYCASQRITRVWPGYVLAFPLAVGVFLFAHVRSIFLALWRGGVVWRGTRYSLRELRAHAGRFW